MWVYIFRLLEFKVIPKNGTTKEPRVSGVGFQVEASCFVQVGSRVAAFRFGGWGLSVLGLFGVQALGAFRPNCRV